MEHVIIKVNEDAAKTGWSFDQWMDRGLGWWRTRADRVINCDLAAIVDANATVVAIGEIVGVKKERGYAPVRIAVDIDPLRSHELLGKRIVTNGSRNPIAFTDELRAAD